MKIAILSANLGNFDKPIDPVKQTIPVTFHRFTDENFLPITGLTPRFQYRIPKLFGWQMFPGYDIYIWLDGSTTFLRPDCVQWYLDQLGDNDIAFFKHPVRRNIRQEVEHIEKKLQENSKYIVPRYKNGLHREFYINEVLKGGYKDNKLYASTAFIYKNNERVKEYMNFWWLFQSRYYTVDQLAQTYATSLVEGLKVKTINEHLFKIGYLSLVSHH
jgi:hypothetical protein